MFQEYDVIVVGGGHAGCEASAAAANLGSKTLLITMDMTKFGNMSCNPAIGGVAKGQIVREIDALGGYTGIITDKSMLQFRMLNTSKGPAMWSPRAQCDRTIFSIEWRKQLESLKNLDFWQDTVTSLIFSDDKKNIIGVKTITGISIFSKSVILTNGTFLNGLMHIGKVQYHGGRAGDQSSYHLSDQLEEVGFQKDRMKTGTSARIDGRSINFEKLIEQKGDAQISKFSFLPKTLKTENQLSCYIAYTSKEVHDVLKTGFEDSPLFNGTIQGTGPRYCPSIEDKLITFESKEQHQLFIEPEGFDTEEYYINGFSSSLPQEVQIKALRKIGGLENVKIFRPGYAIEYDYFQPTQLKNTLETKLVDNLYFAGQINGTTGYEEAASQGLMAAINSHNKINNLDPFILKREEAYIGVLIDDLITKGVDEPYRMFTSRAEYRILLRQDNADFRLTERGNQVGLVSEERYDLYQTKLQATKDIIKIIDKINLKPGDINPILEEENSSLVKQNISLSKVISRPQIDIFDVINIDNKLKIFIDNLDINKHEVLKAVEIEIKYKGYIEREKQLALKINRLENVKLSDKLDYNQFKSISTEARQKLNTVKPSSIGQASRISGVSPSDLNVLLIHLGR